MKKLMIAALVSTVAYTGAVNASDDNTIHVLPFTYVVWGDLNPAHGKASPRAADLWGNRMANTATGFLVKFKDGFSSPPHIHNVTYRGVVISGLVHNDDPKAKEMWLPAGSFWTQPAGEAHITVAEGKNNIAYIEIDSGPYLVKPESEAFDNGERPVNVDPSNFVWLDASDIAWLPALDTTSEVAFLWGNRAEGHLNGSLLKLPNGFSGEIRNNGSEFRAVVTKGAITLSETNDDALTPGSYFGLKDNQATSISSSAEGESILYIRTNGKYNLTHTSTSN